MNMYCSVRCPSAPVYVVRSLAPIPGNSRVFPPILASFFNNMKNGHCRVRCPQRTLADFEQTKSVTDKTLAPAFY